MVSAIRTFGRTNATVSCLIRLSTMWNTWWVNWLWETWNIPDKSFVVQVLNVEKAMLEKRISKHRSIVIVRWTQRWLVNLLSIGSRTKTPLIKPPGHKAPDKNPLDKNPLDKNPPCQKPPRQNILFRNFITFVFGMSYGKEISIWFLAVKYIRYGSIK